MHEMEFSENLRAVARAGAGVNNIPLDACAERGIVVFNTPGANANGVKELVIAGLLLAARDIAGGIEWCKKEKENPNIAKDVEKAKKAFAGHEIKGKKLGCNRPWGYWRRGCQCGGFTWNGGLRIRSVYFRQCCLDACPEM